MARMDMTNRGGMLNSVIWLVWFLTFCAWVVLLGGIASLQNHCHRINNIELYALGIPTFPATGGCSHFYQFWWYVWAFQFCVMVGLPLTLAMGKLWETRLVWTALLAVESVLTMLGSNAFLYFRYRFGGNYLTRIRVTVAGFIMTAALDVMLMISVALLDTVRGDTVSDYDSGPTKTRQRTDTTTTEVPTATV